MNKCIHCGNTSNVEHMEYGQYQCVDMAECLERERENETMELKKEIMELKEEIKAASVKGDAALVEELMEELYQLEMEELS